ncbi:unnamed protein product [Chondrus crispus]|uniref:Uncharacterized protein n=1 Tax=Chondrus crispus TaxID=2769 RepID=R7Q6I1_CHOCR|nr:unnamed protein product [Chondrus crispus]CDF33634.1 unnamed protein product [Chondrus crispus]|eukprot:XP_005713453.1 unnamed protein product [Chondrus crispus]
MLLYVLQGLFHPARKVREVYWRIYNMLYIYAQEGLVPFYPSMRCALLEEDDDEYGPERYERSELLNII